MRTAALARALDDIGRQLIPGRLEALRSKAILDAPELIWDGARWSVVDGRHRIALAMEREEQHLLVAMD